jgi:2,3-bisphosphoglycerate-independent phosphoglycerate mutase
MFGKARLQKCLKEFYKEGRIDYTMPPLVRLDSGNAVGSVKNGDSLFFCCRRGDREVQLTEAFVDPAFSHFPVETMPDLTVVTLVQFHEKFANLPTMFPILRPTPTMGQVFSQAGVRQTKIAESEKASHVTFFFNGRRVEPYDQEQWIIVPSPHSSEFLSKPETSTAQVAKEVARAMTDHTDQSQKHFILANLAAGDIIGHLDDWDANLRCAEAVDQALRTICTAAAQHGYAVAVTADHGLLEKFRRSDGTTNISHTSSRVPFGLVTPAHGPTVQLKASEDATLADVAPTILNLMGISVPKEMKGANRATIDGCYDRLVLVVMDGWGVGCDDPTKNPISAANTTCMDWIEQECPFMTLIASGTAVGLPPGRSGNSETGHLTLGAGQVVPQDELRITQALREGLLEENPAINRGLETALQNGGDIHILTMLTKQSSHGNMEEGMAVLRVAAKKGVGNAWLHLILDGRSSPPQGAADLLEVLEENLPTGIRVQIATAMGRALALDRSGGYEEKTQAAYRAIVLGEGIGF